jgi:hypothetical protein
MFFFQSLRARIIIFLISAGVFAYMVNQNLKFLGKIDTFTWIFGVVVLLNTVNLYMAWKRSKTD